MTEPRNVDLDLAAEIFESARDISGAERLSFVDRACAGDESLIAEVMTMLGAYDEAPGFLSDPTIAEGPTLNLPPIAPPIGESAGDSIGRYRLLEKIGEGGFGTVFMAEQREPVRRRVALKVIKLGMDTSQVIARFEAERQALAMMDHPNIARVLDAGATVSGRPYFVMEYIRGVPLVEYCENTALDTEQVLTLFTSVCNAIQHAHQKGIIHRDIKPSNILVTMHDGVPVPKVIDFGIAKATNASLTQRTLFTEHRQLIGTPAYMSPEQAEMSGLDIDTRSDIYSLGVLLYELLTGATPFDSRELLDIGLAEMLRVIREDDPPRPSTRLSTLRITAESSGARDDSRAASTIRGDLDWIVMKCLEKDRTRRYDTAASLADDIQRRIRNEPVTARSPSLVYLASKFSRRHRFAVTTASAVALLIVGSTIALGITANWALRERDRASSLAQREEFARKRAESSERDAIRQLARATEVKAILTRMLESVNPRIAQSRDVRLLRTMLDEAASMLERGEVTDPIVSAELHVIVGDVYRLLGALDESEFHLATARREFDRGDQDNAALDAAIDATLGTLRAQQRRFEEATRLLERAHAARRELLGADHRETLRTLINLANLRSEMDNLQAAERTYQQILVMTEVSLDVSDELHIDALSGFAIVLARKGQSSDAHALYRRVHDARLESLGPRHPETLNAAINLATSHESLMELSDAAQLYERVLEIAEDVFDARHPTRLTAMENLGVVRWKQGRTDLASPLVEQALEAWSLSVGADHPATLRATHTLATIRQMQGRLADAEKLYLETIEGLSGTLGATHPDTLRSRFNLAEMHRQQGRFAEAIAELSEILDARHEDLGPRHESTVRSILSLAMAMTQSERPDEVVSLLSPALTDIEFAMGEEHPWLKYSERMLADAYIALERADAASDVLARGLNRLISLAERDDATPEDLDTAAWELLMIEAVSLRDPESARRFAQRAVDLEDARNGDRLWTYLDTLALSQFRLGDPAAAAETQRRAVSLLPLGDDPGLRDRLREYEAALEP